MQSLTSRGRFIAAIGILVSVGIGFAPAAQTQQSIVTEALTAQGAWSASVIYHTDDIVTSRGSTWRALRTNKNKVPGQTRPSTAAYWELFASGFNAAGPWVSTTKYQPNDLVTSNGSTWRAKRTSLNKAPVAGANWEQFAAQGTQGIQGVQGPPGPNTGIAVGTSSAPSISFTGDPGTGIFSPSFGKIALVEQGSTVLHFAGNNTAVGQTALGAASPGSGNTAVGNFALGSDGPSGTNNTAVGASALLTNSTGSANTAVGWNALDANSSGSSNTAVGAQALWVNGGSKNVAIGDQTLKSNLFGFNNTAVGTTALQSNVNDSNNTAVGFRALNTATAGDNTAVGANVLPVSTTGTANTAVGSAALSDNTTGDINTAFGVSAAAANTAGSNNTALGAAALGTNTTGSTNVAIGYLAGSNPTTPNFSIFIGNQGVAADDHTIKIGTQGTQTTAFIAGIAGATVANNAAVMIDTTTGQLGTVSSSRRYKEDIAPMPDMTAMLAKLRPVTFHYKKRYIAGPKPLEYGLIAEEVAEVFPALAVFNKDGQPETVKYHLLPTFLLAGYQAQQKTIAAQANEIADLKQRLAAIEVRLAVKQAAVTLPRP
jgi:hypothetical protein